MRSNPCPTPSTSGNLQRLTWIAIVIVGIALVKVRLIGIHFMDLRAAPPPLRLLFEGYTVALFLVLAVLDVVVTPHLWLSCGSGVGSPPHVDAVSFRSTSRLGRAQVFYDGTTVADLERLWAAKGAARSFIPLWTTRLSDKHLPLPGQPPALHPKGFRR